MATSSRRRKRAMPVERDQQPAVARSSLKEVMRPAQPISPQRHVLPGRRFRFVRFRRRLHHGDEPVAGRARSRPARDSAARTH